ncbi:uncharacterized protein LOC110859547 [Folsomia candida]|uniref:C-type lectin domain-containing protein n=1 Tax=Folsomia candida TaxID=158441 RepID=A0A226DC72_FOLCA|nr:uncharacterized protein LOC110859547 [Folsomia candida]OXA42241.1 hypothetical protein Fcan01_22830 [Folsomia candida]
MSLSFVFLVVVGLVGIASGSDVIKVNSVEFGELEFIPLGNFSTTGSNGRIEEIYWFTTSRELVADNANKICESLGTGAKAAALLTPEINVAAKSFLDSQDIPNAWTSGQDFVTNGAFFWRTQTRNIPFTYEDFEKVAPFPNPNCQCVSIERIKLPGCDPNLCKGNYKWFEKPCSEKKRLLCQL